MRRITNNERRARLARRHRLAADHRADRVEDVVDSLVALHSSDPSTVFLSVATRLREPSIDAVERALYEQRTIIRHHAFRRTLWVMTPENAAWAHASATAKIAGAERRKLIEWLDSCPEVEDPNSWLEAAMQRIEDLVRREGPIRTREIGTRLPELAVPLILGVGTKYEQQAAAHPRVMLQAGFEARLLRTRPVGEWTSSEYAWATMSGWLGHELAEVEVDVATAAFLRRWLEQFGPATEADIKWWTGWTLAQTRRALADVAAESVELEDGRPAWVVAGDEDQGLNDPAEGEPWVNLLPALDPTAMGWKERSWYLDSDIATRIFDRSGNIGPTVWADGCIVGGWVQRPDGDIAVEVLRTLDARHQRALDIEIERLTALVSEATIRVRFPAPNQKDLLA